MSEQSVESVISEQVADQVGQMDIIGALKGMIASQTGEESAEVNQKLERIMERYNRMTDEEREQFSRNIKEAVMQRMKESLGSKIGVITGEIQTMLMWRVATVIVVVVILLVLLVFFGYKLYKSIKDKEVKKEEKKKLKQMKKKK